MKCTYVNYDYAYKYGVFVYYANKILSVKSIHRNIVLRETEMINQIQIGSIIINENIYRTTNQNAFNRLIKTVENNIAKKNFCINEFDKYKNAFIVTQSPLIKPAIK